MMVVVQLKGKYWQRYEVLRDCCPEGVLEWGMMMVVVVDFVQSYCWRTVAVVFVLVGLQERSGEESLSTDVEVSVVMDILEYRNKN